MTREKLIELVWLLKAYIEEYCLEVRKEQLWAICKTIKDAEAKIEEMEGK